VLNVYEAGSTLSSGKCMKPTMPDPTDGAHSNLAVQILSPDDRNTPSYEDVILTAVKLSKCPKYTLFSNFYSLYPKWVNI
jgi:hypothetical protein